MQSFLLNLDIIFYDYDNMHYQYGQGLLSEDLWQGLRTRLKGSLASPIIRGRFLERVVRVEMKDFIGELIIQIDSTAISENGT